VLLGVAPMKKPVSPASNPVEQLSEHISGAISSFFELLRAWRQGPVVSAIVPAVEDKTAKALGKPAKGAAKPAKGKAPKAADETGERFPWAQIVKIAQKLLAKDPTRAWRIGELVQAVKKAGAAVESATGMHFGLLPRLRDLQLIAETGDGLFTARLGGDESGARAMVPAKPAKVSARKPAKAEVATKVAPVYPWETVLAAARRLLRKNPARRWSSSELCKSVKEMAGLASAKGLHLGLLPKLKSEGLIAERNGVLTAKLGAEKKTAAPARATVKKTAKPAVKEAAPRGRVSARTTVKAKTMARKAAAKMEPVELPPETVAPEARNADKQIDDTLLAACQNLLESDPFKVWTGADFVKAVRDTGLSLPSWKGLHFSLPAILRKAKLVENEAGGFRASVRPAPQDEEAGER